MKRGLNILLTFLGVLCLLAAIYLLVRPHIDNYFYNKNATEKIEQYDAQHHKSPELAKKQQTSDMVGYITVPDADIKAPVYPGPATPKQLDNGISFAQADESLNDQNIAIAGHTHTSLRHFQFTNLTASKIGSDVYFKVGQDKRHYQITKIYDVKPNDVQVLEEQNNKKRQLTLITCDNYNHQTGEWEDRKIFIAEAV